MVRRIFLYTLMWLLALVIVGMCIVLSAHSAEAAERLSFEHRKGYQYDNEPVERGSTQVTESPEFTDGVRLTTWATRREDKYEYALASAIYFFEISPNARSIKIRVAYDGEGRAWIKMRSVGDDYEAYYPQEVRYSKDPPLLGSTFYLREDRPVEIIRIPARDYVIDGTLELHIVAEGSQDIDVKYIDVETYGYEPPVRVVTRYYTDYVWRQWRDYAYLYFYAGPDYHWDWWDGSYCYVRYTYPGYRYHYTEIRKYYSDYLDSYYSYTYASTSYGGYSSSYTSRVYWDDVYRDYPRRSLGVWHRDRLVKWTSEHTDVRKYYEDSLASHNPVKTKKMRERVRSVLAQDRHREADVVKVGDGKTVANTKTKKTPERTSEQERAVRAESRPSEVREVGRAETANQAPAKAKSKKDRPDVSKTAVRAISEKKDEQDLGFYTKIRRQTSRDTGTLRAVGDSVVQEPRRAPANKPEDDPVYSTVSRAVRTVDRWLTPSDSKQRRETRRVEGNSYPVGPSRETSRQESKPEKTFRDQSRTSGNSETTQRAPVNTSPSGESQKQRPEVRRDVSQDRPAQAPAKSNSSSDEEENKKKRRGR